MPAKRRIPKLTLHKASGQALVRIDGRSIYLGKFGTPKAEEQYNRVVAEWLTTGSHASTSETQTDHDDTMSVAELILAYWRHAAARYVDHDGKPKKELFHIKAAMRPVRRLYGSTSASTFGPRKLITLQREYVQIGYCRTMVNDYVRRIRRMFKWATVSEMIPSSVLHGLQAVDGLRAGESKAAEPRDVKPVPIEFVDAALPHVSRQIAAMIRLQMLCGARPAEITIVRACDIDMSGKLWEYHPARHKSMRIGKDRRIYFGPKAQSILREFLRPDLNAYLFSPADADRERRNRLHAERTTNPTSSELTRHRRKRRSTPKRKPGEHYSTNSYRRAIWRACDIADAVARGASPPFICERCGKCYNRFGFLRRHVEQRHGEALARSSPGKRTVPRWSPNQLRHHFATQMRKEFGIETARVLLGHSNVTTTQIYAERDAELAAVVIGKVG